MSREARVASLMAAEVSTKSAMHHTPTQRTPHFRPHDTGGGGGGGPFIVQRTRMMMSTTAAARIRIVPLNDTAASLKTTGQNE